jgi:hypothetical protein
LTRRIVALLVLLLALPLWGCQHKEKKADGPVYEPPKLRSAAEREASSRRAGDADVRVALGMTKKDVEEIQGKPDRVDVISYPGSTRVLEDWRYPSLGNGCRLVQFTNGKVTMLRNCVGRSNTSPKGG